MAQQNINFGAFPDDLNADAIRTAFSKVDQNFSELFSGNTISGVSRIVAGRGITLPGNPYGTGNVTVAANISSITVKSSTLTVSGSPLTSSSGTITIDIDSNSNIVSNDITANRITANTLTVNQASVLGNSATANFFIGDGSLLTGLPSGYSNAEVAAYLASGADTSNIVTSANISGAYFIGNGSALTGLPSGYSNAEVAAYLASGTVTANIITSANINGDFLNCTNYLSCNGVLSTGLGRFYSLDVGNTTGIPGVGEIWASGAVTAFHADLAEYYHSDANYSPGTVLEFGGSREVTLAKADMTTRVAGVVSTSPGYVLNGAIKDDSDIVAIALQGRVPTRVVGTVEKGDMMVSAGNGLARAEANPGIGSIIGKSLENKNYPEEDIIEVAVGRL